MLGVETTVIDLSMIICLLPAHCHLTTALLYAAFKVLKSWNYNEGRHWSRVMLNAALPFFFSLICTESLKQQKSSASWIWSWFMSKQTPPSATAPYAERCCANCLSIKHSDFPTVICNGLLSPRCPHESQPRGHQSQTRSLKWHPLDEATNRQRQKPRLRLLSRTQAMVGQEQRGGLHCGPRVPLLFGN